VRRGRERVAAVRAGLMRTWGTLLACRRLHAGRSQTRISFEATCWGGSGSSCRSTPHVGVESGYLGEDPLRRAHRNGCLREKVGRPGSCVKQNDVGSGRVEPPFGRRPGSPGQEITYGRRGGRRALGRAGEEIRSGALAIPLLARARKQRVRLEAFYDAKSASGVRSSHCPDVQGRSPRPAPRVLRVPPARWSRQPGTGPDLVADGPLNPVGPGSVPPLRDRQGVRGDRQALGRPLTDVTAPASRNQESNTETRQADRQQGGSREDQRDEPVGLGTTGSYRGEEEASRHQ
jgi:hypothetical protein